LRVDEVLDGNYQLTLRSTESLSCLELRFALVEFIDENGGGPGVRLRKPDRKKAPK
jgi:hypothetical protein